MTAKTSLFPALFARLAQIFSPAPPQASEPTVKAVEETASELSQQPFHMMPFDEGLLERVRLQWHIGDWASIESIDRESLPHHPDRAKIALLIAAALQQTDQMVAAAQYVRMAREWGCNKRLIAQILIAGVHNTMGRASALLGDQEKSDAHFRLAVSSGTPGLDSPMLARTRASNELNRMESESRDSHALQSPIAK